MGYSKAQQFSRSNVLDLGRIHTKLNAILVSRLSSERFILFKYYSTWQGNDLSVIKNFLNIHSPPLNIPSLLTLSINDIKSGQNWFCS